MFLPVRARIAKALPIVERELRLAARGQAAYRWRIAAPVFGLVILAAMFVIVDSRIGSSSNQGPALFEMLLWVSMVYVFLAGFTLTADTVSREKREGTLGLLFLTDLNGADIIFGKLAASSLNLAYGLLGLIPLLAIPVMLGGVSIASGVVSSLAILNFLFVTLSLGILVSTVNWDERRTLFYGLATGLGYMGMPLIYGELHALLFGGSIGFGLNIGLISPLLPLLALNDMVNSRSTLAIAFNILPSHLAGWLMLWLASWLIRRVWHSRGGAPVRRTVDERVFTPRNPAARAGARRRLLEVHPLVWLLERHPGKKFYADGLVLSIMAIWFWGYRSYGADMFGGPSWFLVLPLAILVHLIIAGWVVAESSSRLLEDRRSGALELLLCTSLTDREMIHGHRVVLRRLFARPIVLLALAEVFVAFYGFGDDREGRRGTMLMLGLAAALLLDCAALSWIALRLAVSFTTVNRVGLFSFLITPGLPLGLYFLAMSLLAGTGFIGRQTGFMRLLLIWLGAVVLVDVVVGMWLCRRSVLRRYRSEAVRLQPRAAVAG